MWGEISERKEVEKERKEIGKTDTIGQRLRCVGGIISRFIAVRTIWSFF